MSALPRSRAHIFSRFWSFYTTSLQNRPVRTKMVQSGLFFLTADVIAQLGIEGRSMGRFVKGEEGEGVWDPLRTARLSFYGGTIFAPLAHFWLGGLERIRHASKIASAYIHLYSLARLRAWFMYIFHFKPSPLLCEMRVNIVDFVPPLALANKLVLDIFLWSPFVTFMFPTSLGLLEGKGVEEVKRKVAMGWFPTWQKAVCVFGPTQVLNFTLIPPQHRLVVIQSVGICWNIFLSWQNNKTNKLLAQASARLVEAQAHVDMDPHGQRAEEELEKAEEDVKEAKERKERLKKEGGEMGVEVRMGFS
ncbi:hypothetical protein CI109_104183 [Kwoniella shandongensis]|uniref:Uncharacterized protein n=1 Tax=Kwoniella shandongensis TaxID=1734106 RepID=A0A5M6C0T0_9TREE|nr:uncharacterized protein CI109_002905 [Kwoniella shandongensis]KAA5528747.1 hypothetical protein CI109_002905 [Kwoniella shandongensis]